MPGGRKWPEGKMCTLIMRASVSLWWGDCGNALVIGPGLGAEETGRAQEGGEHLTPRL